jgi:hypothetical protein
MSSSASSSTPGSPTLPPSRLGTKAHWDAVYAREVANFRENPDDEGEVWCVAPSGGPAPRATDSRLASGLERRPRAA